MAIDESIAELSHALIGELTTAGRTVATAESCTGGWIAKALTDVAGSSSAFGFGIVSYANAAKVSMLGVREQTLEQQGAVSEATVNEMVSGALALSGADIAVAVSGVAGPDGGTADKPVGTVWFAWGRQTSAGMELTTMRKQFDGDREAVRARTVIEALQGLRERLREYG